MAKKIAEYLKGQSEVSVITHQDADGITAGSIARSALEREGISTNITVLKQLDEDFIKTIDRSEDKLYWFTDLGSGNLDLLTGLKTVISDHHEITAGSSEVNRSQRMDLMELSKALEESRPEFKYHLNPHNFNRDGAYDISGAGVTYLVAREMNRKNIDLSMLAVIGAVGDLQDSNSGRLVGTNRKILKDAESAGVVQSRTDLRFFGRETRPLTKFIMYASEPAIPNLAKNERACMKFFKELDVPIKSGEHWRTWVDLSTSERKKVLTELSLVLLNNGQSHKTVEKMVGEVYTFPKEDQGTELHDAKEFATLLNSCGRYQAADVGIEVCLGNRTDAIASARRLLKNHRSNLVSMLKVVKEIGITSLSGIQYFHAGEQINENIIGTVCGMVTNSGDADEARPLLGLANCDDGKNVKVSSRISNKYTGPELNLSDIMRKVAGSVGGIGGGHKVAAGATIPRGTEEEFIKKFNQIITDAV